MARAALIKKNFILSLGNRVMTFLARLQYNFEDFVRKLVFQLQTEECRLWIIKMDSLMPEVQTLIIFVGI